MSGLYLTITVCVTGVLFAAGNAFANSDYHGYGYYSQKHTNKGLRSENPDSIAVENNKEMPEEVKPRFLDIITNLVGEIEEKNQVRDSYYKYSGDYSEPQYKSPYMYPSTHRSSLQSSLKTRFMNAASDFVRALEEGDQKLYLTASHDLMNGMRSLQGANSPHPYNEYEERSAGKSKSICDIQECSNVAKIYYAGEPICSAVHLKPWILLTAADCVRGRDIGGIHATVTTSERFSPTDIKVQVKEIYMHPKSMEESAEYNLAILIIYGHREWEVDEFHLPEHHFTSEKLLDGGIYTYVTHWVPSDLFDYKPLKERTSVTRDYSLCGALANIDDSAWYCLLKKEDTHNYNQMDIGSPFYYSMGNVRYCLGIYTGLQLQDSPGHLYQSLNPSLKWIRNIVHQNSVPPE